MSCGFLCLNVSVKFWYQRITSFMEVALNFVVDFFSLLQYPTTSHINFRVLVRINTIKPYTTFRTVLDTW